MFKEKIKMKRSFLIALTSILAIAILSACAAPAVTAGSTRPDLPFRQINASGSGQVFLTPDLAYVTIGVESRSDQVSAALAENNAQAIAISNTLQEKGVDPKDIQTSAFNVYPQMEYNPMGEVIGNVYVVSNTVFVTVRNLQSLGELLDAVVRAGANQIYGVQFDVENKDAAITEARRLAIAKAKQNAVELAEAAGIELGELYNVNVWSASPSPVFEGKGMGGYAFDSASVPVSSGQMTLTMTADLTYEIK
jgi:uncharacterized protein